MARRGLDKRRLKLALTKDLYRRRKIMLKRYSLQQLKQLAIQYGFDDINHPDFINVLVPAGKKDEFQIVEEKDYGENVEDVIKKKRKNKDKQGELHHPDEILFDTSGTPIGGKIKFDTIRAGMYREILKSNNAERDMEHPVLVRPEPTDEEYTVGFMFRYFLQQANSPTAPIIEVDKEQYEGWLKIGGGIDRTFYNGVLLKWRIRGNLQTVTGDDGIIRIGILEGNQNSITLASEVLPALENQLKNLVKFWIR